MSPFGPERPLAAGQSMSALPSYIRHQLVLLSRARRRPRCQDIGPCSLSWCDQAKAGRREGFRCAGRSGLPLSVLMTCFPLLWPQRWLGLDQLALTPGHAGTGHQQAGFVVRHGFYSSVTENREHARHRAAAADSCQLSEACGVGAGRSRSGGMPAS